MTIPLHDPDDSHRWVTPEELALPEQCPECDCCTARLCQKADEVGLKCGLITGPGPSYEVVAACPCGHAAHERRLEKLRTAAREAGLT